MQLLEAASEGTNPMQQKPFYGLPSLLQWKAADKMSGHTYREGPSFHYQGRKWKMQFNTCAVALAIWTKKSVFMQKKAFILQDSARKGMTLKKWRMRLVGLGYD